MDDFKLIFDRLKSFVTSVIEDSHCEAKGSVLWSWLQDNFSAEQQRVLIKELIMEINFEILITIPNDFYLLTFIPVDECVHILRNTKFDWSKIILSANDWIGTFNLLPNNEQRKLIISEITKDSYIANMLQEVSPDKFILLTAEEKNIIQDAINRLPINNANNSGFLPSYRRNSGSEQGAESSLSHSEQKDTPHPPRP